MAGIAGINQPGKHDSVKEMLEKISHRGNSGWHVQETEYATLGLVYAEKQEDSLARLQKRNEAVDSDGVGHAASAKAKKEGIILKRDPLGVVPLYFGEDKDGDLCFASEVKALIDPCRRIKAIPPGCKLINGLLESYFELRRKEPSSDHPKEIAKGLNNRLVSSIISRIDTEADVGVWLSGGLDSSALAALARPYVNKIFTFSGGMEGSPDLEYAREVAAFIESDHHEEIVEFSDLIAALPEVIYHLESFDALLVRSSIINYLVAQRASEYVNEVLSGEGGDELFAGYHYLKEMDFASLSGELIDITKRLHNTALQRVDRSASAHGTIAHVCFLDLEVVDYALQIPLQYKIHNNVEKWILREAIDGKLPENVLRRKKSKFWKGAGVKEQISDYAEQNISDDDFRREKTLYNGWILNSKEELLYYRIFKEHFGELENLSWMGRTKRIPKKVS